MASAASIVEWLDSMASSVASEPLTLAASIFEKLTSELPISAASTSLRALYCKVAGPSVVYSRVAELNVLYCK